MPEVPGHENWYQCNGRCKPPPRIANGKSRYEFPLPKVAGAPVPSKADYSPKNVAPLIEGFAAILGKQPTELIFRYENNTPDNPDDDILVRHPGDKRYQKACFESSDSPSMRKYEAAAKRSALLKLYEENSPAGIKYFQPRCA